MAEFGLIFQGFLSRIFSSSMDNSDWQQMSNDMQAVSLLGFRASVIDADVSETE